MEIGNRGRFCIATEIGTDHEGDWLFGQFCFWIANKQIGDYEFITSIRDIYVHMRYYCSDAYQRESDIHFNLSKEDFFNQVDCSLYGDSDNSAVSEEDLQLFARFDLNIGVDILDDWKIYAVNHDGMTRLLYKHCNDVHISESFINTQEFNSVVISSYKILEAIYDGVVESNIDIKI